MENITAPTFPFLELVLLVLNTITIVVLITAYYRRRKKLYTLYTIISTFAQGEPAAELWDMWKDFEDWPTPLHKPTFDDVMGTLFNSATRNEKAERDARRDRELLNMWNEFKESQNKTPVSTPFSPEAQAEIDSAKADELI